MEDNILARLKMACPFPEVFQDMKHTDDTFNAVLRRKIGHIRADYDGYRWWNTVWPCHNALATPDVTAEIDRTYGALTAKDALADLDTLCRFCHAHPVACVDREFRQEYNFYLVGEHCDFWVRLITRQGDYNMYLNAYAKNLAGPEGVTAE